MQKKIFRPTPWNFVGLGLMAFGLLIALYRFVYGLGAATHLTHVYPWGMWIAIDVMCGVALAAGGFVIAGTVYIFNLKQYKAIARPAVLTAFLGYVLVVVGLLVDLGLPWRIYHPLIFPQVHSAMLEVAMCVMFYLIVLFLEFLPNFFHGMKWKRAYKAMHRFSIAFVIAGIMLSCLHQSSLGSLLLLAKEQLNPLWYSKALPFNFFLSAVAGGLGVVIFESQMSSTMYGRGLEEKVLRSIAKGCGILLAILFVWKMIDYTINGGWAGFGVSGFETFWLIVEWTIGIFIPLIIFWGPGRLHAKPRLWGAIAVIVGLIMNRINSTLTGMITGTGEFYFPAWTEIFITIAIVCAGLLVFQAIVQLLPIFEPEVEAADKAWEDVPG